MIYEHYESKENLYRETLFSVYKKLAECESGFYVDNLEPRLAIKNIIYVYFKFLYETPSFVRMLMWENLNNAASLSAEEVRKLKAPTLEYIGKQIKRGKEEHVFREDIDEYQIVVSLMNFGFSYFSNIHTLSAILNRDMTDSTEVLKRAEFVSNMILDEITSLLTKLEIINKPENRVRYNQLHSRLNDLPGGKQLDMSGCQLEKINLANRKLLNSNFSDALLVGCNMDSAELCFANFSGAFLDHCSMQYVNADEINFRGATLKESDLSYILLYGGNFAHATFYKSDLFNCNIGNTCFEGTRFVNTPTACENIDLDFKITDADWVASNEGQVMQ